MTLPLSRREFVTTSVGYALAVSPITAWAISTPLTGLAAGNIQIPLMGSKETMPGYFARPEKKGAHPCVIVVHEIFGLHEYILDVCRRLAKAGYFAVSPYLYFRQGDATKIASIDELREKIIRKVSIPQVMLDLDATVAWLDKQPSAAVDGAKGGIGITGFCWGGTITWQYAHHNPKLKAGVAWYGRLQGEANPLQPKFPVDIAADLKVPVQGLYGELDKGIPLMDVEKMRELLKKGKSASDIKVFPGADHGFHADYRPSYQQKAAEEGWALMLKWFKQHQLAAKV